MRLRDRGRNRVEKLRLADVHKQPEQLCAIEGHPKLTRDSAIRIIDAQTWRGVTIPIPECVRCHEAVVRLADGRLKGWLEWTKTKEPLHQEMLAALKNRNQLSPTLAGIRSY